jgi:uncharacterized protein
MHRRKFIKNSLLTLGGISFVSGLYSWQIEPFWLDITQQKMPLKNLPANLNGKTLMQISDIHVGNRFDYNFIIESFKKAKSYNPDFVVYTGDYVSTYKDQVQYEKLSEVLKHAVQGSIATIGILGNHDYGRNWRQPEVAYKITSMMQEAGVTMLRNQQHVASGLNFVGFDDYWGMNFNPQNALFQYDSNIASIALCHNPDVCDLDVWQDFNGWILAGHTHGGQVKPPFLPPLMLPVQNKKYTCGLIELDSNRMLYINRAIGHLWQVRFNVRPEISIFELQTA